MENYVAPTRQSCAGHATVSQSRHSLCVIAVIVTLSSESVYSHICLQCHGQRAVNTCIHSRLNIKCSAHPVLPPQSPSLTRSEPIPLSIPEPPFILSHLWTLITRARIILGGRGLTALRLMEYLCWISIPNK